jgi:Kef-type K+ transport system membrane component KefB
MISPASLGWSPGLSDTSAAPVLLGLAIILVAAKAGGELFERLKQPAVLGELAVGVVIGNLHLAGLTGLDFLRGEHVLDVLAEIGIILLLFEIGLESTVAQMFRVGGSALLVAVIGVVIPSILGYGAARAFFPSESGFAHLFVGAILCATSVGITARVLQDLRKTKTPEAKIILGAAIIDDVLGLIVLATVSGMIAASNAGATMGAGAIAWISGKAVLFLVASIVIGRWLAPRIFGWATRLKSRGLLLPLSLSFCFLLSYLSVLAGLAPIVGAFTAGLILENVHYEELATRERKQLEDLLHPISSLLLPVFFVLMGLKVDLRAFLDPGVLAFAGVLTICAIVGKLVCGAGVLGRGINRMAVGFGMIPRGEVGLIFAGIGLTLAINGHPVVNAAIYSGVVIMVMVTTLVTPVLLKWRLGSGDEPDSGHRSPREGATAP